MPFKIVQTKERGRPVLTTVPNEWESDGILLWPKKHEKLRRIEYSKPEPYWQKINCIVKRSNLKSFHHAELEIDNMANFSDTETENERSQINKERLNRKSSNKVNIEQINFNNIAEECFTELHHQTVKDNSITQDVANQDLLISEQQDFIVIQNDKNIPTTEKNTSIDVIEDPQVRVIAENLTARAPNRETKVIDINEAMTYMLTKVDSIAEDFKTMSAEYKIITENQQALFQNQNNIILKLTEIQTQFEEYIKQSFKSPKQNQIPDIKPVGNLKELQELENLLKNPNFEEKLKQQLQVVCSRGKKRGTNNAYALIDVLFSRSFLNECSWAGGSKSNEPKICLKSFTKTLDFFFFILHESDPDFSKPDMQKFFLTILKNSRQRLQSKQIRTSTMRNRQKNKKVTTASSSKELIPENPKSDDESETDYLL